MVRKLVEDDHVFSTFQLLGTATNTVVQKYLNQKKVPQLFVATGASKWGMPKGVPVDHGLAARLRLDDLCQAPGEHKGAKIGMLYQNDDAGKGLPAASRRTGR